MAKMQETEQAVNSVTEIMSKLTQQVIYLENELKKLYDITNKNATSTNDLKDKEVQLLNATERNKQIEAEKITLLNKLKTATSDNIQQNEQLKVQLAEQNKINKQLAKEKLGLIGTYQKESQRLAELKKHYKDLAISGKENTKEAKALKSEINSLDKSIKDIDKSVGDHQRNVGNYTSAMEALPGPIGNTVTAIKTLSKAILASPIGWVMGAIAAVVGAVKTFFTNSEAGQDRWNITMQKAKVVWGNVKDAIGSAGGAVVKFVDDIKNSDKPLAEFGKKIEGLMQRQAEGFKGIKNAIKGIIDGEEGSWKQLGNAAIQAATGVENSIDKIQNKLKENREEMAKAVELANRQDKLEENHRNNLVKNAKLEREIAKLRLDAANTDKFSAEERWKMSDKALDLEQQLLDNKVAEQSETVKLMKLEATFKAQTEEQKLALAQAEADLIGLETESYTARRRMQSAKIQNEKDYYTELAKEIQAKRELQQIDSENIDVNKVLSESAKEYADIEKQMAIDATKAAEEDLKRTQENERKKQEAYQETADFSKFLVDSYFENQTIGIDNNIQKLEQEKDAKIQAAERAGKDTTAIQKKYDDKINKLKKEKAEKEKQQKIANIWMEAAEAVMKSIAATPESFGLPFSAYALAQAAIETALVNKQKIAYKHGTKGKLKHDVLATVSEQGSELYIGPGGEMALTPERQAKMLLPEGSQIFPAYSKETKQAKEDYIGTMEIVHGLTRIEKKLTKNQYWKTTPQGIIKITEDNNVTTRTIKSLL